MQIITFTDKSTNRQQKREGIRVGEYLAVTNDGFIYKTKTGQKLINYQFENYKKALELAEYLEQKYRNFFLLWERWENVDVFRLARHSVKDGYKVVKLIGRLENE